MSLAIEDGVVQGKTAAELGRSLRKYLNDPDRMYRRYHTTITLEDGSKKDIVTWRKRVIGPDGKVHFVECEIDKPGQGVYISARANAERCSRSEINGAYRYADYERWNDEEFVIGIKISLSNNHTILEEKKVGKKHVKTPVPFHDICDDLQGNYPKTFKWAGWHPQCRCHATAITASKEDRKQWLAEGCPPGFFDKKYITDAPPQMVKWLNENMDKVQKAKSLPYWIQDNFDVKRRSVQPKEMEVIEQKVYKAEVTQNSTMRELYKYSPSSLDMSKQTERTSTSVVDVMSDYLDKKTAEKLSNIKLFDEEVRNKIADISIDNSTIGKLIALGTPMASRAETIAKRKELAEWMKTSDLFVSKSVLFDEESGTLFAMHKGHKLDKWKNEYFGNTISSNRLELELSDILLGGMKSGRCVIMLNESVVVGNDMCAALDLFVDGVFTDIKSVTQHDASVINAMSTKSHQIGGFTRSRKIKSDMLILYYHDKSMYDKEKLDSAIEKYKKSKVIQKHIRHLCVVTNDGSILVVDI
ncbi:MAG: hypothetical protein MJZ96_01730 [Paludibacteraceae bacterium]|nr:hypothetical protein [Paludibacteraceae bacterium]